ncbi:Zinc finger BED domain-containing protein 6 [Labeo rohita]|uniref:Zinc finger BED domain-containing protein 6 n=1 Tax=Labeo rohita TaxID=84645 RepID=A0ABQ8LDG8_LABRO|nr:Zinc finger BED domain-containing protein 6 [Labeo rohita]
MAENVSETEELVKKTGATSVIWTWFGFKPSDEQQQNILCRMCGANVPAKRAGVCRRRTSSLNKRPRRSHKDSRKRLSHGVFKEERQVCITTDNGTNVVKAASLNDWTRLQCFGHRLHLAIGRKKCERPRIDRAVGVCKKIVSAFSYSWKRRKELKKAQAEHHLPFHRLITSQKLSKRHYI